MKLQVSTDQLLTKTKSKLFKLPFMLIQLILSNKNKLVLDASIKYILETKRFDGSIFKVKELWSIHNCQKGRSLVSFYYYYHCLLSLLLLLFTFLFFFSSFSLVIVSISIAQAFYFYSFTHNNIHVSGDCNILLFS